MDVRWKGEGAMQRNPAARRCLDVAAGGRRLLALALVGTLGMSATACTDRRDGGAGAGAPNAVESPTPTSAVAITAPKAGATNVRPSSPVTFTTERADDPEITVTDADGEEVAGTVNPGRSRWVPRSPLRWGARYTATVRATGADGQPAETSSSFTVMREPSTLVSASSHLGDGAVVGVGMPLMVRFGRTIPADLRDDVQRRMSVTATPAQPGTWAWQDGQTVHYRPKNYWRAGTKVTYRVAARGIAMGGGWYGRNDLSVSLTVGEAVIMTVDNRSKSMTVTRNGKVVKTMPVSLGKPKTPSSSGTMIVMERLPKTVFDTFEELGPEEGYRTKIDYAQRLTWGGEFIHSAPWSVKDQGKRNVSHGCVNLSPANAKWLFNLTKIGDVVTVKGTEVRLRQGNGWTHWNVGWTEYAKGSALPVDA
ncbi:MAG TPA: Ig-like domain-containing protein [Pilimelia sp.]|nr:Ig-like domain-containing protein [Pilimelia sp.]